MKCIAVKADINQPVFFGRGFMIRGVEDIFPGRIFRFEFDFQFKGAMLIKPQYGNAVQFQ